mmetsp:Transcript_4710/g.9276  ORF Transcript_4710/g.9276 Transcript_4710/m.9276 type:complete len:88 (+) Transcript_4710:1017-1280(+)
MDEEEKGEEEDVGIPGDVEDAIMIMIVAAEIAGDHVATVLAAIIVKVPVLKRRLTLRMQNSSLLSKQSYKRTHKGKKKYISAAKEKY